MVTSERAARREPAIRGRLNLGLVAVHALAQIFQFVIIPAYLLPMTWHWGFALFPLVLLTNPFWSLIHEAIHDLLHRDRRVNVAVGRILSILFGSPFLVLRSSHLLHHKLNRAPIEGTEFYDPRRRSYLAACGGYYFQILGGLYAVEALSVLAFLLPKKIIRGITDRLMKSGTLSGFLFQNWSRDQAVREIRIDGCCIVLWFALAGFCYRDHLEWLAFVIGGRAFLISFLDNVYHYRTPVDDRFFAHNLRLPAIVEKAMLGFNLHGVHHENPALPWSALRPAFVRAAQSFHGDYFRAAARQLAGPVAISELPRAESRREPW